MQKTGIRCGICNDEVWISPLEIDTKYCKCGSCNIGMANGKPVVGKKKGTPYKVLFEGGTEIEGLKSQEL